jgi:hypothetical protein
MNHGQFYRREAINEIWQERTGRNAVKHRVLKRDLHKEFPHARATNLQQALAARARHEDLVADYERFVDKSFTVMSSARVSEVLLLA